MVMSALIPIFVLSGSLLAQAAFCGDLRPYLALLLGTAAAFLLGLTRGRSWKDLSRETFASVGNVCSVIALYLLIGPTIAAWIASGTLPALVLWGSAVISPATYLPVSFALMGLTGTMMGSGISALGTMGIALLGVGQAMGFPLWLIAGCLGGGAFWGNAVSPMSAAGALSAGITGCAQEDYQRLVFAQMIPPYLLTIALYAGFGLFFTVQPAESGAAFAQLRQMFRPGFLCAVPPLLMAALVALKFPTLPLFFVSMTAALAIAVATGNIEFSQIPSLFIDGYRYAGDNATLRAMLNRGGLFSTSSIIITVFLAVTFGGSYQACGALADVLTMLTKNVRSPRGLRRLAHACTTLVTVFTGSSTMSTALIGTLFAPQLKKTALAPLDLASVLGPVAVAIAPVVPWGVSSIALTGIVGISLSGDMSGLLYIPVCFSAFVTPLWLFFCPLRGKKQI